jgi:two-component system sensor histidine kinase ResE
MLSHQLKTPMTSLSMSVNLLREKLKGQSSAQSELLSIASEDCNVLAGLISDLIEAAREPSPDLSLRLRQVDVTKLLRAGLRPLTAQAEKKGVLLELPPEGNGVQAWVDPVKFPWVITNIAGNALRYTAEGGRIKVAVGQDEAGVSVSVSDTGTGIAEEDLACVFEPYVTLDSQPERGTHGLGLAIAKEIVEAHHGTIRVESALGKGTTFRIQMPYDSRETV